MSIFKVGAHTFRQKERKTFCTGRQVVIQPLFSFRRLWSDRPGSRGVPAGKGSGRPDGVREVAVPQPASALRPPAAAPPCAARRAG